MNFNDWLSQEASGQLARTQDRVEAESRTERRCDECGRMWEGLLPFASVVHIWHCPWCETRLSGRAVVWRQQPDDTWVMVVGDQDAEDWPWRGPLRVQKEER